MRRRDFITLLGSAAAGWPLTAKAQQSAVPVIGYLDSASSGGNSQFVAAFRQGLKEAGFVEGQNVAIEYFTSEGQDDRLPALVTELVRRRVALIFAGGGTSSVLVAKSATTSIPIVFMSAGDPVQQGLVASFNRPGGNMTGVSFFNSTLGAKRLELLRELVPKAATVAFLTNPSNPNAVFSLQDIQAAARTLGLQLGVLRAASQREIDAAFTALAQQRPDALIIDPDAYLTSRREQIVALEAHLAIPAAHSPRDWAVAGALMSYGTNTSDSYRQAGVYAGRILKGEKPADLPVMQPTKFELVINLKTAKALGLTVQDNLIALADEVIE
jgi:putative ABC transport system substrate-binding protein